MKNLILSFHKKKDWILNKNSDLIEIFNVKKTDFYFENTNFLLEDVDLILIFFF